MERGVARGNPRGRENVPKRSGVYGVSESELRCRNYTERQGLFLFASAKAKADPRTAARRKLYEKRGIKENWRTESQEEIHSR